MTSLSCVVVRSSGHVLYIVLSALASSLGSLDKVLSKAIMEHVMFDQVKLSQGVVGNGSRPFVSYFS